MFWMNEKIILESYKTNGFGVFWIMS